ncbi:hypothetical protein N9C44_01900 [bacterium]|jgi:hypothetical protein|nr:hypothetical protein [bacterium]|tara:strand:+ start:926 stop:2071 length:1146 start_codon:yes stop_codon:yes gene_type:complete
MEKLFEYDLLHCQDRTWHSWENFTETLTDNFRQFRASNPDAPVKIIFYYTCEGTMWLIENDIWFKAIHNFASKYNVPLTKISYIGSNEKLQQCYDKWHELYCDDTEKFNVRSECFGLYLYRKNSGYYDKLIYTKDAPQHKRDKKYNCLNANIMPHRLKFMLAMEEQGLINTKDSYTSFHAFPELLNPSPDHPILKHDKWNSLLTPELKSRLPIQFDLSGDWEQIYGKIFEPFEQVNNLDWNKVGDFRYIYENCYFTVTTESSESYDLCDYHWDDKINNYLRSFHSEMFITEKTTRPILNLQPQIIYGPSGILEHLKSLGFKTFSNYWNEDYDNHNGDTKLYMIMDLIKELSDKSIDELHDMYWDMMPILKHNQKVLLDISI